MKENPGYPGFRIQCHSSKYGGISTVKRVLQSLEDCDLILRVESAELDADAITQAVEHLSYICLVLE